MTPLVEPSLLRKCYTKINLSSNLAPALGAGDWEFESLYPDLKKPHIVLGFEDYYEKVHFIFDSIFSFCTRG